MSKQRKLVFSESFGKSFKKFVRNNSNLHKAINKTLQRLEKDAFSPFLKTHKLSGNLYGLLACSCGYDCRIIFSIEEHKNQEVILLIAIGTHDEVY